MLNPVHVLKRIPIERLPNEEHLNYIARIDSITDSEMKIVEGIYQNQIVGIDERQLFSFSPTDKTHITLAVVEIYEIPQEFHYSNEEEERSFDFYHDAIFERIGSNHSYKHIEADFDLVRTLLKLESKKLDKLNEMNIKIKKEKQSNG